MQALQKFKEFSIIEVLDCPRCRISAIARSTRNKPESWDTEAMMNLPSGFLPDFGHYWFSCNGLKCLSLKLKGKIKRSSDPEGYKLSFTHQAMRITILISPEQWEKFEVECPSILTVKPDIISRYQSKHGEWIIPFRLLWKTRHSF